MDIKTRKILTSNGPFHKNSNVDRLYAPREEGGSRGISSILYIYVARLISVCEHIRERCDEHKYLKEVRTHESEKLFRATEQLRKAHKTSEENPRKMSRNITTKMKKIPHWILAKETATWLCLPQTTCRTGVQQKILKFMVETNRWILPRWRVYLRNPRTGNQYTEIAEIKGRNWGKQRKMQILSQCRRRYISHPVCLPKFICQLILAGTSRRCCQASLQRDFQNTRPVE